MRKFCLSGIVMAALIVAAMPQAVRAEIDYSNAGRVEIVGPYTGPGLTMDDALGLFGAAQVALGVVLEAPPAVVAVGESAVLLWGARRTQKYRPADVQAGIHRRILERQAEEPVGSVWSVLGN